MKMRNKTGCSIVYLCEHAELLSQRRCGYRIIVNAGIGMVMMICCKTLGPDQDF